MQKPATTCCESCSNAPPCKASTTHDNAAGVGMKPNDRLGQSGTYTSAREVLIVRMLVENGSILDRPARRSDRRRLHHDGLLRHTSRALTHIARPLLLYRPSAVSSPACRSPSRCSCSGHAASARTSYSLVGPELVHLINMHSQSTSGIESTRAVRASEERVVSFCVALNSL